MSPREGEAVPEKFNESLEKIKRNQKTGEEIELVITTQRPKPKPVSKPEGVKTGDHQPCNDCGNTEFIRTGTCFVCVTCGASQGCS